MKVTSSVPAPNGYDATIEVGQSTWCDIDISVRLRFDKDGRIDPKSSSEVPVDSLVSLLIEGLKSGLITASAKATLLTAIGESL